MAGTQNGGRKASITNRERYGDGKDGRPDFYTVIGAKGGRASRGGGFKLGSELAREAGRRGGMAPRRTKRNEG